jgi:hypothetical protein
MSSRNDLVTEPTTPGEGSQMQAAEEQDVPVRHKFGKRPYNLPKIFFKLGIVKGMPLDV